jgi:hypothetical protein
MRCCHRPCWSETAGVTSDAAAVPSSTPIILVVAPAAAGTLRRTSSSCAVDATACYTKAERRKTMSNHCALLEQRDMRRLSTLNSTARRSFWSVPIRIGEINCFRMA